MRWSSSEEAARSSPSASMRTCRVAVPVSGLGDLSVEPRDLLPDDDLLERPAGGEPHHEEEGDPHHSQDPAHYFSPCTAARAVSGVASRNHSWT